MTNQENKKSKKNKKNFLFITLTNLCGDLAWHIQKEGHNVKYFTQDPEEREVADGFIPKITNWETEVEWADIIVFDDVMGQGKIADELRKKGKKVIGGTEYTDRLEDDRSFGTEEMKNKGIKVIPYQDFSSLDDAINYIKTNPGEYVLKPTGHLKPTNLGILLVGVHPLGLDLIEALERYKEWSDEIPQVQLQKKVKGVEIAVGAFFNGKKFLKPININFEHKKLFPGDLGPDTGEMGTSMFWTNENKIFDETLVKFEEELSKHNFTGYIDINCIVNETGIYPLEFTSRFGYPTISIQIEGIKSPIGEFFFKLANGEEFKLKTKKGFQIGVRLVVPPFPFNDENTYAVKSKNAKIYLDDGEEGLHIEDVKLVNNEWKIAGTSGVVMIVCGTGTSMKKAQLAAYERIKKILIPRMYYRNDIGNRWIEDEKKLKEWKLL
ncbi:MAG: phosphoribosylamine--glycine ligase [Candidatus Woesearchaeota archaeon]|jgi:phosphoribosylamine--glycine ligase